MTSPGQRGSSSASSFTETIGAIVQAGTSFLADLLDRIVDGIRGLRGIATVGGLVLGRGCQSGDRTDIHAGVQPVKPAVTAPKIVGPVEATNEPKPIGQFNITFYYVVGEDEVA